MGHGTCCSMQNDPICTGRPTAHPVRDGPQIGGSVRRGEDEDLITQRESKRSAGGS
jgi:hypothetical protein